jgi:Helix-turn-helix domain
MENRIGEVLRRARERREIELSEVEAATRIRVRYLRAIESEEWDVLPGGVYTRAFIRTYGSFLGLDGERLAEDYREGIEGASREWTPPVEASPAAPPAPVGWRSRGPRHLGWLAVPAVLALAALVIVAIPGGGGGGPAGESGPRHSRPQPKPPSRTTPSSGVSISLAAGAEVWVCMLDEKGRHLVNGQILEEGAEAGPFRSGSFTVSFGNGEVSMLVDGQEAEIPATSSPIGYSIDSSGNLTELSEAERPTCT